MRLINFFVFYFTVYPLLTLLGKNANKSSAWVIGGHAGREYEDNAAALHKYILSHTQQPIVWITNNRRIHAMLSERNVPVLSRDSIRARVATVMAPVIIRSHGYRDIDVFFGRYIKIRGLEIHINHCMKIIKAGQMHSPLVEKMTSSEKKKLQKKFSRFDFALASSETERRNFKTSLPHLADKIMLGGGAHLDELLALRNESQQEQSILYFPTWRDKCVKSDHTTSTIIHDIVKNKLINEWLIKHNYSFDFCIHINSKSQIDTASWPSHFKLVSTKQLTQKLANCEVLISDYSGLMLDALYMDIPVVFFPFDYAEFSKCRYFFVDYNEFAFGPNVSSVEELAQSITNKDWLKYDGYLDKRQQVFSQIFPEGRDGYAKRSYETICKLVSENEKQQ